MEKLAWIAAAALAVPSLASGACQLSQVSVRIVKVGFVDECKRRSCPAMKGSAVITNRCNEAVGVQVKMVGLDKAGNPIQVKDFWPASTQNIPPGDYPISLDVALDHDPAVKSYTLSPIRVSKW